jgi:fibro-slime domain-containing protein
MLKRLLILSALVVMMFVTTAHAGLLGHYYNLPQSHPDMERWITGFDPGYVENTLTAPIPTLTPYGMTRILQWDWWAPTYHSFSRIDSDADLQSNFDNSWFPLNEGVPGDPYYFAVHWEGSFYVDEDKDYTYHMASDDDSWLFIDNNLTLDLGGVHGVTSTNYTVGLTQGWHTMDIFFAERHTVQSAFRLNFFSDLEPGPMIPEPATLILFGMGMIGVAARRFMKR